MKIKTKPEIVWMGYCDDAGWLPSTWSFARKHSLGKVHEQGWGRDVLIRRVRLSEVKPKPRTRTKRKASP